MIKNLEDDVYKKHINLLMINTYLDTKCFPRVNRSCFSYRLTVSALITISSSPGLE